MNNPLAHVVLRSGIISDESLAEFQRWKAPAATAFAEEVAAPIDTLEEFHQSVTEALESRELVLVRATNLDILKQYHRTMTTGQLRVRIEEENEVGEADFPVVFGRTEMGEYILPFRGSLVEDTLVEGQAHLRLENGEQVFFSDVVSLFFGDTKAFHLCTPAPR